MDWGEICWQPSKIKLPLYCQIKPFQGCSLPHNANPESSNVLCVFQIGLFVGEVKQKKPAGVRATPGTWQVYNPSTLSDSLPQV